LGPNFGVRDFAQKRDSGGGFVISGPKHVFLGGVTFDPILTLLIKNTPHEGFFDVWTCFVENGQKSTLDGNGVI
jgi:hypothetical protein